MRRISRTRLQSDSRRRRIVESRRKRRLNEGRHVKNEYIAELFTRYLIGSRDLALRQLRDIADDVDYYVEMDSNLYHCQFGDLMKQITKVLKTNDGPI